MSEKTNNCKNIDTNILSKDAYQFVSNYLLNFKESLTSMRPLVEEKIKNIKNKKDKYNNYDLIINNLLKEKGNTKIEIDLSGTVYITKLKTLLKFEYSIFSIYYFNEISNNLKNNINLYNNITTYLFFDIDSDGFSEILDYMRTKVIDLSEFSEDRLTTLKAITEIFGLWELNNELTIYLDKPLIIGFQASPKYRECGTYSIQGLDDPNSKDSGICVSSPYEIIIELNASHTISGLSIKGYTKNSNYWYSGNGSGAAISVSNSKDSAYINVGYIPNTFSNKIVDVVFDKNVFARYIKFKHNSYLGFEYLKILKNTKKI